jgi:large subunit ribosomal protein L23
MHIYQVLKRPLQTEKSNRLKDKLRQYSFEVDPRANKNQVKQAVESAFQVQVLSVNVMRVARRRKHFGRRISYAPIWKKAIVTIPANQRIELFEGV